MTGYLVYDDSRIIGWCDAGDKTAYLPICENDDFRTDDREKVGSKCYIVLISLRYQGIGLYYEKSI